MAVDGLEPRVSEYGVRHLQLTYTDISALRRWQTCVTLPTNECGGQVAKNIEGEDRFLHRKENAETYY